MNWMIYGASGYTGELIAREAKHRGLKPIFAGRSADKVAALATELDCECRVFGIGNPDEMARWLQGVGLVLHCAGPFSATSAPMITACLKARAHYLDITGEISVPGARRMIANAKRANYLRWLLGSRPVQSFLKKTAGQLKGPNAELRASQPTCVWGEATNARGQKKTARIKTENGYSLTVTGSLAVIDFLTRNTPAGGSYTPATLMGADLVTRLPGSGPMTIE